MSDFYYIKKWFKTTNHKDIGILYIVSSMFFVAIGGSLGLLMRAQLWSPMSTFISAFKYEQAVTMHGLVMILWFITPLATGLSNYIVPLQIGAKDMAFPRLNSLGYWLYLFSGLLLVSTLLLPGGGPATGWTLYAPLSSIAFSPQPGMTLSVLALAMLALSITIGSVNFITTIFISRENGMTWDKVPPFTWSVFFTNTLMLVAFAPLLVGTTLLTLDRIFGTVFFSSYQGGSILWTNFFWFFGHPEVYIVVLPVLGILAEVIMTYSDNPLFAKNVFLLEMGAVVILSSFVWVHHMFETGISYTVRTFFSFTTMAISIPFEGIILSLILTMRNGAVKLKMPMLLSLGAIFFVTLGGITGVFQASILLDYAFRGTYWVVGHFHYVMVGTAIFGLFAGLYYWFPKITGKVYVGKYLKYLFLIDFLGFNILYLPYFFLLKMPRRIGNYMAFPELTTLNRVATLGSWIFGPGLAISVVYLLYNAFKAQPSNTNPWKSKSIEWIRQIESESQQRFTYLPVIVAGSISLFMIGLTLNTPVMILGFAIACGSAVSWFYQDIHDFFVNTSDTLNEKWPFQDINKRKLALFVFLTSEVVIFGGFIGGYLYVRVRSPTWPDPFITHDLTLGIVNTLLLLTSSLTMVLAYQATKKSDQRGLITWLLSTFVLGISFLILKLGVEWPSEIAKGFIISGGLPPTTYYSIMGAHALHVGVGLIGVAYILAKIKAGRYNESSHQTVELLGIYWSFIDIIWMFIFPLFYLL